MDDDKKQSDDSEFGADLVLPGGDALQFEAISDEPGSELDGLETDDRQSAEIKEIFGKAFPQYLQPVEEIIKQVLSGEGDEESLSALDGMLSSLMEAASRMGFENVNEAIGNLRESVAGLQDDPEAAIDDEQREEIVGALLDLKDLSEEIGGDTTQLPTSQTIISALKNKPGIGQLVLKRLSAAGLVTVDQLVSARPDEIAAVAGLDRAIVDKILAIVSGESVDDDDDEGGLETPGANAIDATVVEAAGSVPTAVESLHEQVLGHLRDEVEAQAVVEEIKAEIRALRAKVNEQRTELAIIERTSQDKRVSIGVLSERIAAETSRIDDLASARDALRRQLVAAEEAARRKESTLTQLKTERQQVERETDRLCQEVGGLVNRLGKLRRSVARKRTPR
ncbi:MAG: hypothetical protein JRF63_06730 [Deltaproteobacteria bacterium]|nr:hypothetical protein [Deltaproteobacteria bacterium]